VGAHAWEFARAHNLIGNLANDRRQSRRVLVQLLEYDPMALQPSEPGFGSGSGKPDIMFGFLKHLWNTAAGQRAAEQQQQALFRHAPWHWMGDGSLWLRGMRTFVYQPAMRVQPTQASL